jgi:hypothetical protein
MGIEKSSAYERLNLVNKIRRSRAGKVAPLLALTAVFVASCGESSSGPSETVPNRVGDMPAKPDKPARDENNAPTAEGEETAKCLPPPDVDLVPAELYKCEKEGGDISNNIAIDQCTGVDPYKSYPGGEWGKAIMQVDPELRRQCILEITGVDPADPNADLSDIIGP